MHVTAVEEDGRIEHTSVRDVECGGLELLEHDFRHTFSIGRSIPRSLCHKHRVFSWITAHDVREGMSDEGGYGVEVLDYRTNALCIQAISAQTHSMVSSLDTH